MNEGQRRKIADLRGRVEDNLRTGILPFWRDGMTDGESGGFWGRVLVGRVPEKESAKSMVLNGRLLWSYSRAYAVLGEPVYADLAARAFTYIRDCFYDRVYGGVYWMVTCRGEPAEIEKRTYGQAFLIYAMAEYHRVFGNAQALEMALLTLHLLDRNARCEGGGYLDSLTRDWRRDDWVNIWVKNRTGAAKLLNSNMHLFEAMLALARATEDILVHDALREQLLFLLDVAVDGEQGHLKAGMNADGSRADSQIDFGHDAECSYLLVQAAEVIRDGALLERARQTAVTLVDHVYSEGLDPQSGGLHYVADLAAQEVNRSKVWWVQAEGVTAFFNAFQLTGEDRYLDATVGLWRYIEKHIINHTDGDWYAMGIEPNADKALAAQQNALKTVFDNKEMAGKGKCPYHNARMCFEVMARADALMNRG